MAYSTVDELLLSLGLTASTCLQYEYHNAENFLSVLDKEYERFEADNTRSQYIVFHRVTSRLFDQDLLFPENRLLTFESYFPTLEILLVKMENERHGVASRKFGHMLVVQLSHMNNDRLDNGLMPVGTAHFQTTDRIKRAHDSFRPRRFGSSRTRHWPSLVLEVGFSEPYRKLKEDAKWWLTSSNDEVKSVVVISLNQRYREIVVEKWINRGQPTVEYRTVISQEAGRKKINISNNQPLIIRFDDLFLRPANHNEHNITFSTDNWKEFADVVWESQFEQDYKQLAYYLKTTKR
ncbi:hypothetical protein UA08_08884 [Talaromyces atroroseus]|uniref:Uncharacterized protein n=1 Tax=Talaromyces atroroseus TaxID=1441469 RepID=A0A225AD59_TALAT|nr:hypothetical protein UA08_08884 [Talaromyces atroroseus]OKL55854.1 hypothetical protein UA08_08884 [Talaromyces atroroseus]